MIPGLMTATAAAESTTTSAPQLVSPESLSTLSLLGKTATALLLVVAVIWLFSYLLKRFNSGKMLGHQPLKVISSTAVGQRERVVVVEIEKKWLVLGVGGGQVTRLHSLAAPSIKDVEAGAGSALESFADKFRKAKSKESNGHDACSTDQ